MEDRFTLVCQRLERDFGEPRLEFPGVSLRPAIEWTDLHPPVVPLPDDAAAEVDTDLVSISGGHSFRIDGRLGDEEIAVEIASRLQDDAMDRLGAPWPCLALPGGTDAVLEPRLTSDGFAVWTAKAGYRCPIGQLQAVFGALHMIR